MRCTFLQHKASIATEMSRPNSIETCLPHNHCKLIELKYPEIYRQGKPCTRRFQLKLHSSQANKQNSRLICRMMKCKSPSRMEYIVSTISQLVLSCKFLPHTQSSLIALSWLGTGPTSKMCRHCFQHLKRSSLRHMQYTAPNLSQQVPSDTCLLHTRRNLAGQQSLGIVLRGRRCRRCWHLPMRSNRQRSPYTEYCQPNSDQLNSLHMLLTRALMMSQQSMKDTTIFL